MIVRQIGHNLIMHGHRLSPPLLWLMCLVSADVKPVAYCDPLGCECYIMILPITETQSEIEDRCDTRGMTLHDIESLHISEDLDSIKSFIEVALDDSTQDSAPVVCSMDMSDYDVKALDSASREFEGPLCDFKTVDSVELVTKCSPKCLYEPNTDREHLATKILSYWEDGNIAAAGSECSQDEVTDIDCCMFAGTLPETIEVRWYYLTANSGIAIRLFCKNKHLPSDDGTNYFITVGTCDNTVAHSFDSEFYQEHCTFVDCVLSKDDGGTFSNNLTQGIADVMGDDVLSDSHQVIIADDLPWLVVTCASDDGIYRDIQFAQCKYVSYEFKGFRLWKWAWDLTTLDQCRTEADNGLDFRQDQNYLATYVMRGTSQCFILSYDRMVRREEFCDDFGPVLFKPSYPYQHGGADSDLYKFLEPHGRHFWLGYDINNDTDPWEVTWKDGDAFDWSASPVTQQDYSDISDTSICFTFDIENTDQLGLEDCLQNNRELCTLPVEVNTVTGSWSEWNEWSSCQELSRSRIRKCSAGSDFCTGCDGVAPRETEICCDRMLIVENARVTFPDTSSVIVKCYPGHSLEGTGDKSATYSCTNSADWLSNNNSPRCILDTCETPPDLSTTIRFPKGYVMEEEYKVGDRITYVCATGLIVNGTISDRNKTLTCLPGKTWDGSAPVCVGQLFDVKVELPTEWLLWKITDVKYTRLKRVVAGRERGEGQFFAGDMITLQCQEGYEFAVNEITSTVQVTTDGFQGRTLCERPNCGAPPDPTEHSVIVSGWRAGTVGSSVTYECLPGFVDRMSRLTRITITCSQDRQWVSNTAAVLNCTTLQCPKPADIENGALVGLKESGSYHTNDVISVVCDSGYGVKMGGRYFPAAESRCNLEGKWSNSAESKEWCTPVECPKIKNLINAEVISSRESWEAFQTGDNVTVQCYPDHVFIGTDMEKGQNEVKRTCLEDGTWTGYDEYHCYTYQLQYGPIVDVYPDDPGKITITWLNTELFQSGELSADLEGEGEGEGEVARYVILFYGKDFGGTVRANFSISHTARRSQKVYTMDTRVVPGFNYDMWIACSVERWTEGFYGEPDAKFYPPTGIPAIIKGATLDDMIPILNESHVYRDFVLDESKIVVDIEDVFSAVNGSVHLFTLIVLERNDFMPDDVREGTLEMPLLTWAKARKSAYWPPYMIHKKCQLFTGAGCPDLLSMVETFRRQHRFRRQSESEDGSGNRENTKKKRYSAKDPIFTGDDAFVGSLGFATGLEDVSINNDNIDRWLDPSLRQSGRRASYTIGSQTCDPESLDTFCNGKLKFRGEFCIKLRAYTNDHYIDSPCARTDELTLTNSLTDGWQRAKFGPLGLSLLPLSVFVAVVVGVLMNREESQIEDKALKELRDKKRSEKARMRWRNAIFKAYDKAFTANNDEAVNLLAVASLHNTEQARNANSKTAVIKATSSLKLERKCSYFTRYRKWFEEMRQSALQRHISLTSLSIKSDGEEELYNPEEIIVEQHIPYEAYQHGKMMRGFQAPHRSPKRSIKK